jgi:protease-4
MLTRSCLLALTLLTLAGCGAPSLLITPVQRRDGLEEIQVQRGNAQKVAIIPIDGLIMNARTPGLIQEGDNKLSIISQQLDRAERDSRVKAVVLRINSPGGTVTGSDNLYELVRRFKERSGKPVVASVQEVGASGGYYAALAADRIVACPTSVVGSIGVIFNTMSFEGTLGKLGVRADAIKSGKNKDIASPLRNMTPQERALLQETVDEYFARFKTLAVRTRQLEDEGIVETATDGRVFSGEKAKALGLVDEVGFLEDAIVLAQELGDAENARAVMYRKPFGPGGSIYAETSAPLPAANTLQLPLPQTELSLPGGFYYLWQP